MQFTANREQSILNFFNSFKDKLLFVKICLALLLQKFNINLVESFIKEIKIIRSFFVEKKNQKTISFFVALRTFGEKKWTKKQLRAEFENGLVKIMNINKTFICSKIKVENKK